MRIYAEPISHRRTYVRSESPLPLLPTSLGRSAVATGLKARLGPQGYPSREAESIGSHRCSALTCCSVYCLYCVVLLVPHTWRMNYKSLSTKREGNYISKVMVKSASSQQGPVFERLQICTACIGSIKKLIQQNMIPYFTRKG